MSQMPPAAPQAFGAMPPRRHTDGVSIASLVTGFLGFCIPLLLGLAAIILGLIGLRRTRNPQLGGRGLAITGLILGVLSIAFWLLAGGGIAFFVRYTAPNRELARQFILDVSNVNATSALSKTDGTMSAAALQDLIATTQANGSFSDVTTTSIQLNGNRATLQGAVTFSQGAHAFSMEQVKTANGWKVVSFQIHQ